MSKRTDALVDLLVAAGYGTVNEYSGETVVQVLKEFAVFAGAAASTEDVGTTTTADTLLFLAENWETTKSYPVTITAEAGITLTVTDDGGNTLSDGDEVRYGTILTATATAGPGDTVRIDVNGEQVQDGEEFTVTGATTVSAIIE